MKIVLFGATGNVGQRIATEALSRGHEVVGVVREPEKVKSPEFRMTLVLCGSLVPAMLIHVVLDVVAAFVGWTLFRSEPQLPAVRAAA